MCSNVYDDVTDFEFCGFIENAKSKYLGETFFLSNKKKIQFMLLPTNCLGVFDHFVGLALEGLNLKELLSKRKS